MSDENLAFLLDETKAYWFKESSVLGLLPDGSLIREWRNIPIAHRTACLANLAARRIETAPKANTEAYTGVYRITRIEDIIANDAAGRAHSVTIREYLAKGLATALTDATQVVRVGGAARVPGTATTWPASPAHPGGTSAIQQDSRTVTLRWVNLDPRSLEAINTAQTDVTKATMTVNTETLTGPWYNIARNSGQLEDGSGFYEEVWSLAELALEAVDAIGTGNISANRFVQGVPKNRVKTVLDAEIAALGATYKGQGCTYRQKIYWRENTADIITETETAVKREVAAHTAEISAAKTETARSGENLYTADIAAYAAEVASAADGHVKRMRKGVNPDGTFSVSLSDELAQKQEWSGATFTNGNYASQYGTVYWWRGKACTLSEVNSAIAGASLTSATNNSVLITKRDDNWYDYSIEKSPIRDTATIPGWTIGEVADYTLYGERQYKQIKSGAWMYRTIAYRVRIYQNSTYGTAQTNIQPAGEYPLASSPAGGTGIQRLSNGQYLSTLITSDEATATWYTDSGLPIT